MIARAAMWARLIGFAAFVVALLPIQLIALRFRLSLARRLPILFHRAALATLGVRVTLVGRPTADRPLLILANHLSWLDILVLGALMPVSFVAKSEVADWPIFGLLARLQRTVFVERAARRKSGDQARAIGERLAAGDAVVLFAEGTTGDGTTLLPFRSTLVGAARMAMDGGGHAHVAVQPVTIAFTRRQGLPMGIADRLAYSWVGDIDLLPHLLMVAGEAALDVTVAFEAPLAFDREADRKAVTKRAEMAVRARLAALTRGG